MKGNANSLTNNLGSNQNDFFQWDDNSKNISNIPVSKNSNSNSTQPTTLAPDDIQFTFENNQLPPGVEIPAFNFNFDNSLFPDGSGNQNSGQENFGNSANFDSFNYQKEINDNSKADSNNFHLEQSQNQNNSSFVYQNDIQQQSPNNFGNINQLRDLFNSNNSSDSVEPQSNQAYTDFQQQQQPANIDGTFNNFSSFSNGNKDIVNKVPVHSFSAEFPVDKLSLSFGGFDSPTKRRMSNNFQNEDFNYSNAKGMNLSHSIEVLNSNASIPFNFNAMNENKTANYSTFKESLSNQSASANTSSNSYENKSNFEYQPKKDNVIASTFEQSQENDQSNYQSSFAFGIPQQESGKKETYLDQQRNDQIQIENSTPSFEPSFDLFPPQENGTRQDNSQSFTFDPVSSQFEQKANDSNNLNQIENSTPSFEPSFDSFPSQQNQEQDNSQSFTFEVPQQETLTKTKEKSKTEIQTENVTSSFDPSFDFFSQQGNKEQDNSQSFTFEIPQKETETKEKDNKEEGKAQNQAEIAAPSFEPSFGIFSQQENQEQDNSQSFTFEIPQQETKAKNDKEEESRNDSQSQNQAENTVSSFEPSFDSFPPQENQEQYNSQSFTFEIPQQETEKKEESKAQNQAENTISSFEPSFDSFPQQEQGNSQSFTFEIPQQETEKKEENKVENAAPSFEPSFDSFPQQESKEQDNSETITFEVPQQETEKKEAKVVNESGQDIKVENQIDNSTRSFDNAQLFTYENPQQEAAGDKESQENERQKENSAPSFQPSFDFFPQQEKLDDVNKENEHAFTFDLVHSQLEQTKETELQTPNQTENVTSSFEPSFDFFPPHQQNHEQDNSQSFTFEIPQQETKEVENKAENTVSSFEPSFDSFPQQESKEQGNSQSFTFEIPQQETEKKEEESSKEEKGQTQSQTENTNPSFDDFISHQGDGSNKGELSSLGQPVASPVQPRAEREREVAAASYNSESLQTPVFDFSSNVERSQTMNSAPSFEPSFDFFAAQGNDGQDSSQPFTFEIPQHETEEKEKGNKEESKAQNQTESVTSSFEPSFYFFLPQDSKEQDNSQSFTFEVPQQETEKKEEDNKEQDQTENVTSSFEPSFISFPPQESKEQDSSHSFTFEIPQQETEKKEDKQAENAAPSFEPSFDSFPPQEQDNSQAFTFDSVPSQNEKETKEEGNQNQTENAAPSFEPSFDYFPQQESKEQDNSQSFTFEIPQQETEKKEEGNQNQAENAAPSFELSFDSFPTDKADNVQKEGEAGFTFDPSADKPEDKEEEATDASKAPVSGDRQEAEKAGIEEQSQNGSMNPFEPSFEFYPSQGNGNAHDSSQAFTFDSVPGQNEKETKEESAQNQTEITAPSFDPSFDSFPQQESKEQDSSQSFTFEVPQQETKEEDNKEQDQAENVTSSFEPSFDFFPPQEQDNSQSFTFEVPQQETEKKEENKAENVTPSFEPSFDSFPPQEQDNSQSFTFEVPQQETEAKNDKEEEESRKDQNQAENSAPSFEPSFDSFLPQEGKEQDNSQSFTFEPSPGQSDQMQKESESRSENPPEASDSFFTFSSGFMNHSESNESFNDFFNFDEAPAGDDNKDSSFDSFFSQKAEENGFLAEKPKISNSQSVSASSPPTVKTETIANSSSSFASPPSTQKRRFFKEFEDRFTSPIPQRKTPRKSFLKEYQDLFPELKEADKKPPQNETPKGGVDEFFKGLKERAESVEQKQEKMKKQILEEFAQSNGQKLTFEKPLTGKTADLKDSSQKSDVRNDGEVKNSIENLNAFGEVSNSNDLNEKMPNEASNSFFPDFSPTFDFGGFSQNESNQKEDKVFSGDSSEAKKAKNSDGETAPVDSNFSPEFDHFVFDFPKKEEPSNSNEKVPKFDDFSPTFEPFNPTFDSPKESNKSDNFENDKSDNDDVKNDAEEMIKKKVDITYDGIINLLGNDAFSSLENSIEKSFACEEDESAENALKVIYEI